MDVLDVDDRIVDYEAEREDQREQRDSVDRVAEQEVDEQREAERDRHRERHDDRLAPSEHHRDQDHDDRDRDPQAFEQLLDLAVRGVPRVARDGPFDVVRQDLGSDLLHPFAQPFGDVDGIRSAPLRHRDDDGRAGVLAGCLATAPEPHVRRRLLGAVLHRRHIAQVDGPAASRADHEFAQRRRRRQQRSRLDDHGSVAGQTTARDRRACRRSDRRDQRRQVHSSARQSLRIRLDAQLPRAAAMDVGLAGVLDLLQSRGDLLRDATQRVVVLRRAVQRDDEHRDVVDRHRLHGPRTHVRRQRHALPLQFAVQLHEARLAVFADEEAGGEHAAPALAGRVDVLDAGNARDDLLQRRGHLPLDLERRSARRLDHDVGDRNDDLRILLTRRRSHRDEAGDEREQQQQRREVSVQEHRDDALDEAGLVRHRPCPSRAARTRLAASATIRSPSTRPDNASTPRSFVSPRRT